MKEKHGLDTKRRRFDIRHSFVIKHSSLDIASLNPQPLTLN